jgi:hypothetical protein
MTIDWLAFVNVALYALVVSQHAFYALGMERAQAVLAGPAYVELRNALDTALRRSLPVLYPATLLVTVLSLLFGNARVTTAVALAGLLVDAWFMLRINAPINALIQTWTPERHPPDWQSRRAAWISAFHRRQIAVAVGFASLLLGVLSP